MLFKNKSKKEKCESCGSVVTNKFSFCPYCGESLVDEEKYAKDYGLLGKGEELNGLEGVQGGFGIADKLIGSLVNSLMKNLDKQFRQMGDGDKGSFERLPNGIRVKIGPSVRKQQKNFFQRQISEKQLEKMNSLPREKAQSKVKRLNDSIIYELDTPGIESPHDVFVSKLESGYEIKAIGGDKVYVNSLPVNLPIKSLSLNNDKLFVEFFMYQQ